MNDRLQDYLDNAFAPFAGEKNVSELKQDLLADLRERFEELKAEGDDDETAFNRTVESIGDIEETVREMANLSRVLERQVLPSFKAGNLTQSDLSGTTLRRGDFIASALRGADFSGSDLTGSRFVSSDVRDARFNSANLTDCRLSTVSLDNAHFCGTVFIRTSIRTSGMNGARFSDARFIDAQLVKSDLRGAIFDNCVFEGVDFKYSDLRGVDFDGMTFNGVKLDKTALGGASFRNAVLKNVSFVSSMMSRKYFTALKTVCFEGAKMDKPTYAVLKGWGVNLDGVTVI